MFPEEVDTSRLVPERGRAGHWVDPATGNVYNAPAFTRKSKTPEPPNVQQPQAPPQANTGADPGQGQS